MVFLMILQLVRRQSIHIIMNNSSFLVLVEFPGEFSRLHFGMSE